LYSEFLRHTFTSSWSARLGYLLAKPALRTLRLRMDPRRYNGAIFLGLNNIAVKSHGGTDALGFANAIGVAVDMQMQHSIDKIGEDFARLSAVVQSDSASAIQAYAERDLEDQRDADVAAR
jgi:glycerol-3-phosphate acyltransferase PlsX